MTGLALLFVGAVPLTTFWVAAALVLYVAAVIVGITVYAPLVRRQAALLESHGPASPEYRGIAGRGTLLGVLVTVDIVAIVFLMVVKPTLG